MEQLVAMKQSLIILLVIHLLLYAVIGLNVSILRQVVVFAYLSFIPGFVFLKFLNLKKTHIVDIVLFSVGLSLALLMFVGLLINELFLFGISEPLTIIPLTIGVSLLTLVFFFVSYMRSSSENFWSFGFQWSEQKSLFPKIAILALPPVVGVIGALYLSIPVLFLLFIIIAALFAVCMLSTKIFPSKLYPILVFSISLALLFQVVFTSKYVLGYDVLI